MKRIVTMLITILLVGGLSLTALAHEVPDLSQNGSITFTMDWGGEPLDSGKLSMYRVGDIVEDDGNYSFELIDELKNSNLSLDNVNDRALAEDLAVLAEDEDLLELTAPIRDGRAEFADLEPGLYVVVQAESDASKGFAPISPFLISTPNYENGHYEPHVVADPKVPLETEPSEPTEPTEPEPTKPKDPNLPQTGQLNWPVPVLVVSGLTLFIMGWFLRFGRKKEKYEK